MSTALVVDSDPLTIDVLRTALSARGYEVITAADAEEALRAADRARPHVILVEDRLPDLTAPAVIVALRARTTAPILVLSASADPDEMVRALDAGADDHIRKPFDINELLARVRAVVRRAIAARAEDSGILDTGSFMVDLGAKKVWRDGTEVRLTPIEWNVLEILIHHEGKLVSQRDLLRTVWGPEHGYPGARSAGKSGRHCQLLSTDWWARMAMWLLWLVVAVVLGVAEIFTLTAALGVLGAAALVPAGLAVLGVPLPIQLVAFAVAAVIGVVLVRPIALEHMRRPQLERFGVDALIGKRAFVVREVSDRGGLVRIDGEDWTARSFDDDTVIPEGTVVNVMRISGTTAYVYPLE
jgi:two-component system KDP operon response regulator KdpE